jgi:hypothetical protein
VSSVLNCSCLSSSKCRAVSKQGYRDTCWVYRGYVGCFQEWCVGSKPHSFLWRRSRIVQEAWVDPWTK